MIVATGSHKIAKRHAASGIMSSAQPEEKYPGPTRRLCISEAGATAASKSPPNAWASAIQASSETGQKQFQGFLAKASRARALEVRSGMLSKKVEVDLA
jgi:hypothetical protein